jgi:hypothetical protein
MRNYDSGAQVSTRTQLSQHHIYPASNTTSITTTQEWQDCHTVAPNAIVLQCNTIVATGKSVFCSGTQVFRHTVVMKHNCFMRNYNSGAQVCTTTQLSQHHICPACNTMSIRTTQQWQHCHTVAPNAIVLQGNTIVGVGLSVFCSGTQLFRNTIVPAHDCSGTQMFRHDDTAISRLLHSCSKCKATPL